MMKHKTINHTPFLFFLFFLFFNSLSYAENKEIDTAMALYKSMNINAAATHAISNIKDINSLSSIDKLKFSLIINKNLSMYKDIYEKSITTQKIFLTSISSEKNSNKSQFAPIFLAEIHILQKKYDDAKKQIENFEKNTPSKYNISAISRAWLAKEREDKESYAKILKNINTEDPLTAMALDSIAIMTTKKSSLDTSIIKKAESKYIGTDHIDSNRFSNYAIRIYSQQGKIDDASRIYLKLDQKSASFVEEITQFKVINFYQPSIIDSIASYYFQLSKKILSSLKKDPKYHDMAVYYLSDLELITANKDTAKNFKEEMKNISRLPKSLSLLLSIRENGHNYLHGETTRAHQGWKNAVNNEKNNPAISAEAILMCLYLDASCPSIVQIARLKAENGRSKRFENLNTNIGRYFLHKNENNKAVRLLENALDRSNADGLLKNNPMLLLNLAEAYRIEKRFSESLQIYFSLGNNFPILRQVQDAVQGEYLFRQRSNGSNRVF